MKILRVRLRNYRGTDEREVRFAPTGITLVVGPNEIGKSSLAEAIDVIFDHLDSTSKQEIKAIKPVHRDAGAEIEIDVETGSYAFTYFKRFHKDKATRLHVSRPKAEDWTGREAHDRARAILEETVDLSLWKALRIEQGRGIDPLDLRDQTALSRALDVAAGGSTSGPREENLYEKAEKEFLRYFTDTGKEKKELAEATRALGERRAEADRLREELGKLESDIDLSARLAIDIATMGRSISGQIGIAEQREADRQGVAGLKSDLEKLQAKRDAALKQMKLSADAVGERDRIVAELARAERDRASIAEDLQAAAPALHDAIRGLEQAQEALSKAQAGQDSARRLHLLRNEDFNFRRDEHDLADFEERRGHIDRAVAEAREAEARLRGIRIDEGLYEGIRKADLEVTKALARLETEGPSVRIEALSDVTPSIDDEPVALHRGEQLDRPTPDSLRITFPGVARVTVSSGTSAESMARKLKTVRSRLGDLCAQAGVTDPKAAAAAMESRREALAGLASRDQVIKRELSDLTIEELDAKLARSRERVASYHTRRGQEPPLPPDLSTARSWLAEAERELAEAEAELAQGSTALDAARDRRNSLHEQHRENTGKLELAGETRVRARERLEQVRARESDEAIDTKRVQDAAALAALEDQVRHLVANLQVQDPEAVEMLARNAWAALEKSQNQLRDLEMEQIKVSERLKHLGEEGLSERLDNAESRIRNLQREHDQLRSRAAAARALHEVLTEEREAARRNYVAPLRDRIDRLGRIVFGGTFGVELGDDLSVLSRTLEGRTISWSELSGGAREQIGLIARLACAMIVSRDGGVPLIIDDALGNTDPVRLEGMAAVLSVAARDCQIMVLTCYPERYRHVGDAQVLHVR